ncbi:MAG TPA: hypothetical protein VF517_04480, partial [Thermoleophilaceae bacterium]
IARTSPKGGGATIQLDRGRRRVVKFRSGSSRNRVLVATVGTKGAGRHVLRLVTLGGGPVEIDGVGVAAR